MHVAKIFMAQPKLTFEDCNPQGLSAILTVWMLDWNCGKSCEYCRDNHSYSFSYSYCYHGTPLSVGLLWIIYRLVYTSTVLVRWIVHCQLISSSIMCCAKLMYCCDSVLRLEVDIVMISISYASKTKSLLSFTSEDSRFEEPKTPSIFCMELNYVHYYRDLHWPQTPNGNRKGSGNGIRNHWRVNGTNLKLSSEHYLFWYLYVFFTPLSVVYMYLQ